MRQPRQEPDLPWDFPQQRGDDRTAKRHHNAHVHQTTLAQGKNGVPTFTTSSPESWGWWPSVPCSSQAAPSRGSRWQGARRSPSVALTARRSGGCCPHGPGRRRLLHARFPRGGRLWGERHEQGAAQGGRARVFLPKTSLTQRPVEPSRSPACSPPPGPPRRLHGSARQGSAQPRTRVPPS